MNVELIVGVLAGALLTLPGRDNMDLGSYDVLAESIPLVGAIICTFGGALLGYWLENRRKDWRSLKKERTRYLGELIKMREIEDIYLELLAEAGDRSHRSYKLEVYAEALERGIGKPAEGKSRLKRRFESVVG